jgi:hypothetical protein
MNSYSLGGTKRASLVNITFSLVAEAVELYGICYSFLERNNEDEKDDVCLCSEN